MWSQTFSGGSHSVEKIMFKKKRNGAAHSETKEEEEKEKNGEDSMMDEPEGGRVPAKKAMYVRATYVRTTYVRTTYVRAMLFCKICHADFRVSHGGKSDLSQHEKSAKHKRAPFVFSFL